MQEWASLIDYLIGKELEVELSEIEKEATTSADFDFDIVITLATSSALFKPYLPALSTTPEATPQVNQSTTPSGY